MTRRTPDRIVAAAWLQLMRRTFPDAEWNAPHFGRVLPRINRELLPDRRALASALRRIKQGEKFEFAHDGKRHSVLWRPAVDEFLKRRTALDESIKARRRERDEEKHEEELLQAIVRGVRRCRAPGCKNIIQPITDDGRKVRDDALTCSPACKAALWRHRKKKQKDFTRRNYVGGRKSRGRMGRRGARRRGRR